MPALKYSTLVSYKLRRTIVNEASDLGMKSGIQDIPSQSSSISINFTDPYPNSNYVVLCNVSNQTSNNPVDVYVYRIKDKDQFGFTVELTDEVPDNNYVLDWATFGPSNIT